MAPLVRGSADRVDNIEARVLAVHNRERAALGIAPLQWDDGLAADAARWAAHLSAIGYMAHAPQDSYDPGSEGENLWYGTAGYFSAEAMVGMWVAEKRNFRPGIFPANSVTGNFGDVGHYTQMMWRATDRVGCALAESRHIEFLVCRYSERGNVIGERPF